MTKEQKIEKWVQNSRFVNKRWAAVADRVKDSIEFLEKNSNLSLKNLLERIQVEEYPRGKEKEENTHNTLYIFVKTDDIGSSRFPKLVDVYLTLKKDFLKARKQKELFPHYLVSLDSRDMDSY